MTFPSYVDSLVMLGFQGVVSGNINKLHFLTHDVEMKGGGVIT